MTMGPLERKLLPQRMSGFPAAASPRLWICCPCMRRSSGSLNMTVNRSPPKCPQKMSNRSSSSGCRRWSNCDYIGESIDSSFTAISLAQQQHIGQVAELAAVAAITSPKSASFPLSHHGKSRDCRHIASPQQTLGGDSATSLALLLTHNHQHERSGRRQRSGVHL
jgi:hypothetical protein